MDEGRGDPPHVYDPVAGDVIDVINGEIDETNNFVYKPVIRAESYGEWERKKSYDLLRSDKDKKMWSVIKEVGERINARGLRYDVYNFMQKMKSLKTRSEFRGKSVYTYKKKFILAVYYVIAKKNGLHALAEQISSMPCLDTPEPCFVSRRKGDPEFKRYLRTVLKCAAVLFPSFARDPVEVLEEFVHRYDISLPEVVKLKARENMIKLQEFMSGRKVQTIVAAALKLALDEVMTDTDEKIFEQICNKIGVSATSVINFLNHTQRNERSV